MRARTLRTVSLLAGLVAVSLAASASSAFTADVTADNKALARRYVEEIVNQNKPEVADEIIAPEYVYHGRGPEGRGPEVVKEFVGTYRVAFPDIELTIEDMIAEGDRVAVRLSATGTNTGPLGDTPPTGKPVSLTAIFVIRVAEGKVVEEWEVVDELGMMEQLGLVSKD